MAGVSSKCLAQAGVLGEKVLTGVARSVGTGETDRSRRGRAWGLSGQQHPPKFLCPPRSSQQVRTWLYVS